MKTYTLKEQKLLSLNPYTYKVTKNKLFFTASFKEAFWLSYKAGKSPRKILSELGYDLSMFGQKQIDSIVQNIKRQAESCSGFSEGINHDFRPLTKLRKSNVDLKSKNNTPYTQGEIERLEAEVVYLRQEVEFLKKLFKVSNNIKR